MPRVKGFLLLALACLSAHSAAAADPTVRPATKKWVVDYGETECTALKEYGDGRGAVQLVFRPSPLEHSMQVIVIRTGFVRAAEHVKVDILLGGEEVRTTALHYSPAKTTHEVFMATLRSDRAEALKRAQTIAVRSGVHLDERFAVPGMDKLATALEACAQTLREHWNLAGPGAEARAKWARPEVPLGSYFSADDYPAQSVAGDESGKTRVTMMIDEKGTVADCLVEEPSGIASLDAMTCIVLRQRARFHPAEDVAGKPMRSMATQTVNWRMRPWP